MERADKKMLFWPDFIPQESETFYLGYGQQVTLVAMGLSGSDEVSFEVVYVPAMEPDPCACPPGQAVLPGVAAYAPLTCNGTPVMLTEENPIVVIGRPQNFLLRAVRNYSNGAGPIFVWASYTHSDSCCCVPEKEVF